MPDISMCANVECRFRASCYRYVAKPSGFWQSWGIFKPGPHECDVFMPCPDGAETLYAPEVDRLNRENRAGGHQETVSGG